VFIENMPFIKVKTPTPVNSIIIAAYCIMLNFSLFIILASSVVTTGAVAITRLLVDTETVTAPVLKVII
jgi:hypothetical protein